LLITVIPEYLNFATFSEDILAVSGVLGSFGETIKLVKFTLQLALKAQRGSRNIALLLL
jgi:hypothetical protein